MVLLARNDPKALAGYSSENQSCLRPHSSWRREKNRWGDSLGDGEDPRRKRRRREEADQAPDGGQEAAMAVPPPSLTIICWQSLQERRSPTFSRVRAASASSTAR